MRINITNKTAKQGISLIWVVLFCSIVILLATIMTSFIVLESHISSRFDASQQALAAAKSGVAWGKDYVAGGGTSVVNKTFNLVDPADGTTVIATYVVTVSGANITSIGKVGTTVTRKLVYDYAADTYSSVLPSTMADSAIEINSSTDNGSFSYQYQAWMDTTNTTNTFGITDGGNNEVIVTIDPMTANGTATLSVKAGTATAVVKSITDLKGTNATKNAPLTAGYDMTTTVTYRRGLGVELEILTQNPADSDKPVCRRRIAVATQGRDLDFASAHLISSGGLTRDTTGTYGDTDLIDAGSMYIDGMGEIGLDFGPSPCGGTVTITGLAGTQVWCRKNMGTLDTESVKVDPAVSGKQTDNGIAEKFCYANDINNCHTYGGLYQYNEAVGYSLGMSVRGVCPLGFRVPTMAEWQILINNITASAAEATKFNPQLSGKYSDIFGSYGNTQNGTTGFYWTSDFRVSPPEGKRTQINSSTWTNNWENHTSALSVRCIKN